MATVIGVGRVSSDGNLADNGLYVYSRHAPVGGPDLDLHASSPETIDLLCSLTLLVRPSVIVEAGTYCGHTSLSLANLARNTRLPMHVWTADPTDPYASGLQGQAIAASGLESFVTYYHGFYEDMLVQTDVRGIGLAYLDASSRDNPNLRWEHFQLTKPRMATHGLIVIDDLGTDWPHAEELRLMADLYLPFGRGLGIFTS